MPFNTQADFIKAESASQVAGKQLLACRTTKGDFAFLKKNSLKHMGCNEEDSFLNTQAVWEVVIRQRLALLREEPDAS